MTFTADSRGDSFKNITPIRKKKGVHDAFSLIFTIFDFLKQLTLTTGLEQLPLPQHK